MTNDETLLCGMPWICHPDVRSSHSKDLSADHDQWTSRLKMSNKIFSCLKAVGEILRFTADTLQVTN